ncbi:MAG: flagellar basal body-associated FliL family protein [Oligoflexia bacterium]|nr:flagellar basal body-associated FliL family protein [Oligoflexia bacterium]
MAKEEPKDKEEASAETAAKPKSKKKLIIIVAAVLVLVGGGAAAALMSGSKKAPESEEEQAHQEENRHLAAVQLDTIIVNLSENASFLKVKMTIEYDPEILAKYSGEGGGGGGAGGEGEGGMPPLFAEKEAQIRDAIINTLSAKSAAEVLNPDGKDQLKEDLVEAINEALGLEEGPVVNVYFKEFLVQ